MCELRTNLCAVTCHNYINNTKCGKQYPTNVAKIVCHLIPDFTAKMHQILFRLGLRPRPRWRSSQRSPDPLVGFRGKGYGRAWGDGEGPDWDKVGREETGKGGKWERSWEEKGKLEE